MKRLRSNLLMFLLVMALGLASPARSGELDDIYRLADEKKLDQAMKKLDAFLKENPRDAQARFLQGLIFTGKSRNDDAIRVFQELGTEFPDLPEPFNNLAVLYAERGEYDRARQALVNAIRILPDYATAHENLGDIYAKLASQSYAQSVRINGTNTFISAKLELMKKLFVLPNTPTDELLSVGASGEHAERFDTASLEETPAPVADVSESSPRSDASESPPRSDASESPPRSDASESSPRSDVSETKKVEDIVRDWARAWSSRDVDGYLSFYSDAFRFPKKYPSRGAWEKYRHRILGRAATIRVTLSELKVTLLGEDRARVTFTQSYWSRRYQDKVRKTIDLRKEDGTWKFVRERS